MKCKQIYLNKGHINIKFPTNKQETVFVMSSGLSKMLQTSCSNYACFRLSLASIQGILEAAIKMKNREK